MNGIRRTRMTTYAYQTLVDVEYARANPADTAIEIVQDNSREACVMFDMGNGDRCHRTLSKRNRSEASALDIVRMYLSGDLPAYDH